MAKSVFKRYVMDKEDTIYNDDNEVSSDAILTVVTGVLMTSMDDVYKVMSLAIGRELFTHELPYYHKRVVDMLVTEYPELSGPVSQKDSITKENYREFLWSWTDILPLTYIVPRIKSGNGD